MISSITRYLSTRILRLAALSCVPAVLFGCGSMNHASLDSVTVADRYLYVRIARQELTTELSNKTAFNPDHLKNDHYLFG